VIGGTETTYSPVNPTIYGGYSQSETTNFSSITLASTSTSRINYIQSSGGSLPPIVNVSGGVGSIYKLLNINSSYLVAWNVSSSLDTNGRNLLGNSFNFNNSNPKTITVSSGNSIQISNNFGGSGAFVGSITGTTLNLTGSSVIFDSSGSFNVPDAVFPELSVGVSGSNQYTVTVGSSGNTQTITTINERSQGGSLGKIVLAAGSTLNVVNMIYTNNAGVTNPLTTTVNGTQATLRKTSGTLLVNQRSIRDIVATGGAAFKAPTESPYNNIDAGNNVGWDFGPFSGGSLGNFFFLF
jgi:hypothetical protein